MNEEQQRSVAFTQRRHAAWDIHHADAPAAMVTDEVSYANPDVRVVGLPVD